MLQSYAPGKGHLDTLPGRSVYSLREADKGVRQMGDRVAPPGGFRSRDWFANVDRPDMTAVYLERFMNYGMTPDELRSGRPIIGIARPTAT